MQVTSDKSYRRTKILDILEIVPAGSSSIGSRPRAWPQRLLITNNGNGDTYANKEIHAGQYKQECMDVVMYSLTLWESFSKATQSQAVG